MVNLKSVDATPPSSSTQWSKMSYFIIIWKTIHRSLFTGSAEELNEMSRANKQTEKKSVAHYGDTLWNRETHIHTHSHNTSQVITELYWSLQKRKKKCLTFPSHCMFRTSDSISSHSPFGLIRLSIPFTYINHLSSITVSATSTQSSMAPNSY